jgi:hypothetical protein
MPDRLLLVSHAGFTLVMVGIMWAVQLAIYPQFRSVPAADFVPYITSHSTRIVAVLAPFAPFELLLALLLWVVRPDGTSGTVAFISGLLLAIAWIATGLYYAPIHGELQANGYDAQLIDRLILTNWIRTALWSVRGVIALLLL